MVTEKLKTYYRWKAKRTAYHHVQRLSLMVSLLLLIQMPVGWHDGSVQVRHAWLLFLQERILIIPALAKYVRGMYAVRVSGRIPEDVEMELERRNIKYRPRDQTDQDWSFTIPLHSATRLNGSFTHPHGTSTKWKWRRTLQKLVKVRCYAISLYTPRSSVVFLGSSLSNEVLESHLIIDILAFQKLSWPL